LKRHAGSATRSIRAVSSLAPLVPVIWALALALLPAAAGVAAAQTLTVAETETLVRASYFEGMPEEPASRIGPTGAERLVEMLFDPEEARSHAQILLALGLCGSPDSMSAILAWSESLDSAAVLDGAAGPGGQEIDRNSFKAWQALPYAFGHLARFDRRAVVHLETLIHADAPNWSFRHHRGPRLRALARRSAATSLGLTGLPEARRALDRAGRDASDARFDDHLRSVRALHAARARGVAN
jgi:hypothetical protein